MWTFLSSVKYYITKAIGGPKASWTSRTKHVHFPGGNYEHYAYVVGSMLLRKTHKGNGNVDVITDHSKPKSILRTGSYTL